MAIAVVLWWFMAPGRSPSPAEPSTRPPTRIAVLVAGLLALAALVGSFPLTASRPAGDADLFWRLVGPAGGTARRAMPWLFGLSTSSLAIGLFVLSLPVVLWAAQPLFAAAWRSVQHRQADENTLIAGAIAVAMLVSSASAFAPGLLERAGLAADVSFEEVTALVALALLGRLLRARALTRIAGIAGRAPGGGAAAPRLGERAAGVISPAVLALAIAAFVLWFDAGPEPEGLLSPTALVSVLAVASPALLALAAPTAFGVGAGYGAACGVRARDGDALEAAAAIDVVVLDKTGTVTEGRPSVIEVVTTRRAGDPMKELVPLDEDAVLRYAAAVERFSDHPLAAAIVREAGSRELTPPDAGAFEPRPGRGASAVVGGHHVAVGSATFLIELGVDVGPFTDAVDALAAKARTPVLVAVDGVPVGLLGLADRIKPSAVGAVRRFKRMGLHVVLVTADVRKAAIAVAGEIGVDQVESGMLPAGKVAVVSRLQRSGRRVAMVGDASQDAQALAAADVGIAIRAGRGAVVPATDIELSGGDLRLAVTAVEIARRTRRAVRQNLFWAFAYHAVGLPIAAGLLYPLFGVVVSPVLAGTAMVLSSSVVLANGLRLRRFTPTFAVT